MICVPCFERREVLEVCLPSLLASKYDGDEVRLYNDGSTEYDAAWLKGFGVDCATDSPNIGVDAQRRMHVLEFMNRPEFSYLYFSDSDCLMDPFWRARLFDIHTRTGLLTCGYNTATHEGYKNNTYKREGDVVYRSVRDPKARASLLANFLPITGPGGAFEFTAQFDIVLGVVPGQR